MQGENRFIKLLLFSTAGGEVLLYGFSSPTNQPFLTWKQREISKKHQSVLTAILPFHEAEIFEKSLTQESTLSMAKITMKSPQLVIRPMVLVNDTHSRQHGPVVEYAYLKELWNVQKEALFQEILHSFGTDGKELYRDVQDLIQWCQEECGIDFSSQGHRFGNFEHYQSAPLGTGFKILTHKELELKKVTIQKTEVFSRELVVNCAAEHRKRWLINQTKLLPAEESSVEFTAKESMSRVVVQIWDGETGELLFARDLSMMLGVNLEMNFDSSSYHVRDAWTKKLLQSASNRKREIEEKIEKVDRVTTDRTVSVKSSFHTEIDTSLETGRRLLTDYRKTRCLGAFIPNTGKDGEIDMVHDQRGINAPEYTLWALLHDRATVSRAGFDILFDQAGHIWYRENGWFHGSYRLMLKLDPAAFLLLLDNSRSPLMFDILAAHMSFYPWSERLFLSASKSKLLYTQLLCAQWMFSLFRDGKLSNKQVLDTLAQLTPQKRSLQTAYFLSQITFFTRTKHTLDADAREQWEQLYQQLLSLLAADLLHCSEQERNTALFWLYDNEQCSQCSLQLDLSRYIEDSTIRDAVLQKAVEGIQKYLIDSKYERNLKTAVDLYLTSAEQLYGGEVEKQILGKLVDWRTFERAAEPELKNYAYDKWHYAYIRAKWQLFLLAKYAQLHPGAEKTLKWLKEWRTRLPNIANEESGTNLTGS